MEGTLVVSAKHIKISTESYIVRSSSTYNFAFWHSTPGFCSLCYLWSQVFMLFVHVNGPKFQVHWHVEKFVQGDTKIYVRGILVHKWTVWNLRNRILTFMRNSSYYFSLGNCWRLVHGWTANCPVIDELFLRNSCELLVLFGMILFLSKL